MRSDLSNNYSNQSQLGVDVIILLLIIGAIIFGAYFLTRKYIIPFLNSRKAVKKAKRTVFRLEVITWVLFILFALTQLMKESFGITLALVTVIALIGVNFWVDFFAGIRFRFENKIKENDPVRFNEFSGIIQTIGTTAVQIKTEDEELIFINYRQLAKGTLIKRQAKGKLLSAKITLDISGLSEEQSIDAVEKWVYQCPWSVPSSSTSITTQPVNKLNVTVYAVDDKSLNKIERMLKKELTALKQAEQN